MAKYLVTGAAGFIASRVCEFLLNEGHAVVGVDDMNDAYDTRLKHYRLSRLKTRLGFVFCETDIACLDPLRALFKENTEGDAPPFDVALNLVARAGVRQSIADTESYCKTNVTGALNLLELWKDSGVNCDAVATPYKVLRQAAFLGGGLHPLRIWRTREIPRRCCRLPAVLSLLAGKPGSEQTNRWISPVCTLKL